MPYHKDMFSETESLQRIGRYLRDARKKLGVSQAALAGLAGTSHVPINQIEQGKPIRLETLIRICDALGLEIEIRSRGRMGRE